MSDDSERLQRDKIADRVAVERIVGRSVADGLWPAGALPLGTRVQVVQDPEWGGPWARQFLGVVDDTGLPEAIVHPKAKAGEFSYFVRFDEPELDRDGDGPYRKAQIWGRYLRRVDV